MKKQIVTNQAPATIGPYSQAIESDGLVFCSGQIALDHRSGQLISGGIEAEVRCAMGDLTEVLRRRGLALATSSKPRSFSLTLAISLSLTGFTASISRHPAPRARRCRWRHCRAEHASRSKLSLAAANPRPLPHHKFCSRVGRRDGYAAPPPSPPRAQFEGRAMAHVLAMAAGEIGHPITELIAMEAANRLPHRFLHGKGNSSRW